MPIDPYIALLVICLAMTAAVLVTMVLSKRFSYLDLLALLGVLLMVHFLVSLKQTCGV